MWIAVDGMAGGDFSIRYFVALLTGLYIMVRGLQNIDEGLRLIAKDERTRSSAAWVDLWESLFYGPYFGGTFRNRASRFNQARQVILAHDKRRAKASR
jgi:hypothetical protein